MGRHRKAKKIKLPSYLAELKPLLVKKALNAAVALLFLVVLFLIVKAFLYRSDYFIVRNAEVRESFIDQRAEDSIKNELLNLYGGMNIFKLNLKYIAGSLRGNFTDAKDIVVGIALPDKLTVRVRFRKPVAVIRDSADYAIDEEGVVIPGAETELLSKLPLIEGINIRYDEKKGKKAISSANLRKALTLIKEIKYSKFMSAYRVSRIDARDVRDLSFYLWSGPEIRIGSENFRGRLGLLERTLKDPRLVLEKIKYIDLRFRDVVIGPQ